MFQDVYSRRGRAGFSTVKPFQLQGPEMRQEEEEEETGGLQSVLEGVFKSAPGIIGSLKGKNDAMSKGISKGSSRVINGMKKKPGFGGMFALGGKLKKDQWGIVGEEGPEIVTNEGDDTRITPMGPKNIINGTPDMMFPPEEEGLAEAADPIMRSPTSPSVSPLQQAKTDYESAISKKPEKQKWWKDALVKTAQIISNTFNPNNQVKVQGYGAMKRDKDIQETQGRYGALQQVENAGQATRLREEQIKTIPTDDANKKLQIEGQRQANKDRVVTSARNTLFKARRYDPKNAAHQEQAKAAGIDPKDLEGWDDRNPIEKTVAGVQYRLNRDTGAYEPTNLPVEESKTLVEYAVDMPDGERRVYKVSQKDGANFSTQMSALGAKQAFQAGENEKGRAFTADQTRIRNQMTVAVKQYDDAVAGKRAAESEAAKTRLLILKKELDDLDQ